MISLTVRIIARSTLKAFYEIPEYADSKGTIEAWFQFTKKSFWSSPDDIKSQFKNASILKDNRICFNIAGNKYRLIVKVEYRLKIVFIRFIGTHAQYDKIDANLV
jgi:mRNA interferase HigB